MDSIIQNTGDYVLKPQREGGGNNFYNDEIKYVENTSRYLTYFSKLNK
jgi:hypothetical protein